jgi:hypothetical protein
VDREGDQGFFPFDTFKGDMRGRGLIFFLQVHYGGVWVGVIHFILAKINQT